MAQIIHDIDIPNSGNGDELRTAFGNQNTMNTELYTTKVDKVTGKALSTNDFTNDEKAKLAGIEAGAQVNVPINFNDLVDAPEQLFASVGYFDYNDSETHTTPLVIASGVSLKLTNDTLGAFTDVSKAPYGVTNVWDSVNNQFDFTQIDVGDTIDLRVDLDVTTTGTNKTLKMFIKFGIGTPSEFLKFIDSFEFKTAVTDENITANIPFYIGSDDIKNAPAELYILADTTGSVKVNGWYTRIIRKSINVIDVDTTSVVNAESRTITNRWALTNLNEYYRSRADYAGFNAETINNSTTISTINQTTASLSAAFYRTPKSKKISKIYIDGSNIALGITSLKLGVFAFQRATVSDPNFSAVNSINLGEFTLSKTSGVACQSWDFTPTNIEIPANYLVSCVLMKAGGTGSEVNVGIDFKFEDYI